MAEDHRDRRITEFNNKSISDNNIRLGQWRANSSGFGRGIVYEDNDRMVILD
jgi:hypothetical protein